MNTRVIARNAGHRGWGWLRRCASGRWQASYVGPDKARHRAHSTFHSKMDGEHWLAEERRLIERQEWTPPATRAALSAAVGLTVAAYARQWIDGRDLKPGPRYDYGLKLAKYIEAKPIGSVPVASLTPLAVRSWYDSLDPSKPSARASAYSMLSTILNGAVRDGYLDKNPANIEGARSARKRRKVVLPTVEEVAIIADAIEPRLRAWVLLGHFVGLRIGEACELRRADIDLDNAVVHVARGMRHIGNQCVIDAPKNGEDRWVPIAEHIVGDLRRHMMEHVGAEPDSLVFAPTAPSKCGHLSQDRMRAQLKKAMTTVGKGDAVAHTMRHWAGTAATASGASQAEVMAFLGHRSHRSAAVYQHLLPGREKAVAEGLSKLATG